MIFYVKIFFYTSLLKVFSEKEKKLYFSFKNSTVFPPFYIKLLTYQFFKGVRYGRVFYYR